MGGWGVLGGGERQFGFLLINLANPSTFVSEQIAMQIGDMKVVELLPESCYGVSEHILGCQHGISDFHPEH